MHVKDFPNKLVSRVAVLTSYGGEKSPDSVLREAFGDKIDYVSLVLFHKEFRVYYITNEDLLEEVEEDLIFFNRGGSYVEGEKSGSLVPIIFSASYSEAEEKDNTGLILFDLKKSLSQLRDVFTGAKKGTLGIEKAIFQGSGGNVGEEVKEALRGAKRTISSLFQGKSKFSNLYFFKPSKFVIPKSPSRTFYLDYYFYIDTLKDEENILSELDLAGRYRLIEEVEDWGFSDEDVLDKISKVSVLAFERLLEKIGGLEVSFFAQIKGDKKEVATFRGGKRINKESYLEGVEVWLVVFPVVLLDETSYSSPVPEYLALVMLPLFAFKSPPLKELNIKTEDSLLRVIGKSYAEAKVDLSFYVDIYNSGSREPLQFHLSFRQDAGRKTEYLFFPKGLNITELEKKKMAHQFLSEIGSILSRSEELKKMSEGEIKRLKMLHRALEGYVVGDICLRLGERRVIISRGNLDEFIFPREGYPPIPDPEVGPLMRTLISSGTWANVRDMFVREGLVSFVYDYKFRIERMGNGYSVDSYWVIGRALYTGLVIYEDSDYMVLVH